MKIAGRPLWLDVRLALFGAWFEEDGGRYHVPRALGRWMLMERLPHPPRRRLACGCRYSRLTGRSVAICLDHATAHLPDDDWEE